ncbi:MAG: hypothetical protein HYT75_07355 [Deltaproteobacteria bacterium]|nr:hypothetical protein [Deltaproteobacteria bacterium]
MTKRVRNEFIISTGDDPLKAKEWNLTKKTSDPIAGQLKNGADGKDVNGGRLKSMLDAAVKRPEHKPDVDLEANKVSGKSAPKTNEPARAKQTLEQNEKYVEAKTDAKNLGKLFSGVAPQKEAKTSEQKSPIPEAKQFQTPQANERGKTADAARQNIITQFASIQNGRPADIKAGQSDPKAAERPKDGSKTLNENAAAKPKQAKDGSIAEHLAAGNQAAEQQAGAQAAKEAIKSTQHKEISADNNDIEETKEKEDGEETKSASPWGKASAQSKKLGGLIGGLQSEVGSGTTGGGSDDSVIEIANADRIDRPPAIEEGKDIGVEIFNADENIKVAEAYKTSTEYKNGVEQLLTRYVPIKEKVDNWTPAELAKRVIADARTTIDEVRELLNTSRTDPRGLGMIA